MCTNLRFTSFSSLGMLKSFMNFLEADLKLFVSSSSTLTSSLLACILSILQRTNSVAWSSLSNAPTMNKNVRFSNLNNVNIGKLILHCTCIEWSLIYSPLVIVGKVYLGDRLLWNHCYSWGTYFHKFHWSAELQIKIPRTIGCK